jgi:hypothetical protein
LNWSQIRILLVLCCCLNCRSWCRKLEVAFVDTSSEGVHINGVSASCSATMGWCRLCTVYSPLNCPLTYIHRHVTSALLHWRVAVSSFSGIHVEIFRYNTVAGISQPTMPLQVTAGHVRDCFWRQLKLASCMLSRLM